MTILAVDAKATRNPSSQIKRYRLARRPIAGSAAAKDEQRHSSRTRD